MLSMNGLNVGKYVPNSTIHTEPFASKYTVQGEIGRGKFAVVRKCIHNDTGEIVAAKVIRKRRKGKSCREEILREVVMLEYAMAHPRLVSLREVFETPSELILVTEYCAGGELFHECVIEESFKEEDVVNLLVQILEGLCFLHENNIVHLDLKPQNILLTEQFPKGNIKICDLGFACLTNTGEDIRDIIGTPDYVAPEVLDYEPLSIQTDMWSLGVLSYVMLTACSPFAGDSQQETFCNISQVKLDFPEELFAHISPLAQDFIRKLVVKDPRGRMTARQSLDHPWLQATRTKMQISLPVQDHAAALAQGMVPPSNWNPDRRNSVSKAPISPTLEHADYKQTPSLLNPVLGDSHLTAVQKDTTESSTTNTVEGLSLSYGDDMLTQTIQQIGIDSAKFSLGDTDSDPTIVMARKRQSAEIPLKKAKCSVMPEDNILKENEASETDSVFNGKNLNSVAGQIIADKDAHSYTSNSKPTLPSCMNDSDISTPF